VNLYIIFLAFILDLIFKDIEPWPHPVRFIGQLINKLEKYARNQNVISLKVSGLLCVLFASILVSIVVFILISLPLLGWLFKLYFAYAGLALGGLLEKGREVLELLKKDNIEKAREKLSYLVSRDTSCMEKNEILKTLAETLSENFNDAFVAPFFYLVIGGPVLLWLYKTVSTFDSMWGYKTEKFKDLGFAGAKLDDIMAYLPARISFIVIFLVSYVTRRKNRILQKIKCAIRDAKKMESPNAGWSMAACAHVFEKQMGGISIYFGKEVEKPVLGPPGEWTIQDIEILLRYLLLCGIVVCISFLAVKNIL